MRKLVPWLLMHPNLFSFVKKKPNTLFLGCRNRPFDWAAPSGSSGSRDPRWFPRWNAFRRWRQSRPWRWCTAGGPWRSWTSPWSAWRSLLCTCPRWQMTQPDNRLNVLKVWKFSKHCHLPPYSLLIPILK